MTEQEDSEEEEQDPHEELEEEEVLIDLRRMEEQDRIALGTVE